MTEYSRRPSQSAHCRQNLEVGLKTFDKSVFMAPVLLSRGRSSGQEIGLSLDGEGRQRLSEPDD